MHDAQKPFACDMCKASFGRKEHLNKHVSNVHKQCFQCSEIFSTRSDLDKHVNTAHDGGKSFECDECKVLFGYKSQIVFLDKSHLIKHVSTVHKSTVLIVPNVREDDDTLDNIAEEEDLQIESHYSEIESKQECKLEENNE